MFWQTNTGTQPSLPATYEARLRLSGEISRIEEGLASANLGFFRVDWRSMTARSPLYHRHWAKISEERFANSLAVENFLQFPEAMDALSLRKMSVSSGLSVISRIK
ncbi:MAG: hypothetical protein ACPHO8_18945, partial [Mariniblastus sp.]